MQALTNEEVKLLRELVNERRLKLLNEAIKSKDELLAQAAKECKVLLEKLS